MLVRPSMTSSNVLSVLLFASYTEKLTSPILLCSTTAGEAIAIFAITGIHSSGTSITISESWANHSRIFMISALLKSLFLTILPPLPIMSEVMTLVILLRISSILLPNIAFASYNESRYSLQ